MGKKTLLNFKEKDHQSGVKNGLKNSSGAVTLCRNCIHPVFLQFNVAMFLCLQEKQCGTVTIHAVSVHVQSCKKLLMQNKHVEDSEKDFFAGSNQFKIEKQAKVWFGWRLANYSW